MSSSNVSRRTVLAVGGIAAAATMVPTAAQAASPTLELVHKGSARYTIYHGPGEGPVVRQAARELAETVGAITGVSLPIVVGAQPPRGAERLIVLGQENPLTAALALDYSTLGDDGFALRTVGQTIYLTGPIPRGTLYGVYWVLDRLCGVRWWSPDFTSIPKSPSLALPVAALNGDQVPRFRYREISTLDGKDAVHRQHNLLNGLRGQDEFDTLPRTAGIDTWSRYWPEDHPEFFNTVLPESKWESGGQIAMMDGTVRATAADRLLSTLKQLVAAGELPTAAFAQNDQPWTPDAASKAFADLHGGALSAPLIDMMNDLAARVTKQYPDAMLETEAYNWSFPPPAGMKVHDSVVMTVAPITADFGKSLMGPGNPDIDAGIRGWGNIAKNIVIWDYITDFHAYPQPFPNWWSMCEAFPEFAKIPSIQGYFGEGPWNGRGAELMLLRQWVLARLMWNPNENPDALIREFLQGYYGPAAGPLYEYMKLMADAVAKTNTELTCYAPEKAPYLNFDSLTAADALMAKAYDLVKDDAVLSAHLAGVRLGIDFQILIRRDEFGRYAQAHGITWDPDTKRRLDRFQTEIMQSGLNQYSEGGGTTQSMLTRATNVIDRVAPPPPAVAAGLPASDWFEIQDYDLTVWAPVVQDDLASDHGAVKMPGDSTTWFVTCMLDKLPASGTWKLYIAARIPASTTGTGTNQALTTGVYKPFGNDVSPSVDSMRDGRYHEIAIPGTYSKAADSDRFWWIAPVNNPDVPFVYVDRLIGVRA
ncbi:DUF4838 domain-containing protein [Kribbella sp. GL6]|uniref:DUF4838 domain-containing protein n=1 Tax=Kribbella sp. GL6 TaxID=3419765 RepID=UPI003D004C2E